MKRKREPCEYCDKNAEGFQPLNRDTVDYNGGLEIALHKKGMLRIRNFPDGYDGHFDGQDIVNIKYCPMCRRYLGK